MKAYLLTSAYDQQENSVFRSVGVVDADRQRLTAWRFAHQQGREFTRAAFDSMRFEWRDPKQKPIADFPASTEPGGIYSARAVDALRGFLEPNGDIHALEFVDPVIRYFLFDCWSDVVVMPNTGYNLFHPESLKSIAVNPETPMPDIFNTDNISGLLVSERFKAAAETAGLTGMVFTEVTVIHH